MHLDDAHYMKKTQVECQCKYTRFPTGTTADAGIEMPEQTYTRMLEQTVGEP